MSSTRTRQLGDPGTDAPVSGARRWAITMSVMMVTVMQVLDTSVTNVALPHMQGALSAGVEEMSWVGFIFPPLQVLALATIRLDRLSNATAAYNVVRNVGGSVGIALATTLLVRRSQGHQAALVAHVNPFDPETTRRLAEWTEHFRTQGADAFTAGRRALAMMYRGTVEQAQVLAYIDDFWLIAISFIPLASRSLRRSSLRAPQEVLAQPVVSLVWWAPRSGAGSRAFEPSTRRALHGRQANPRRREQRAGPELSRGRAHDRGV